MDAETAQRQKQRGTQFVLPPHRSIGYPIPAPSSAAPAPTPPNPHPVSFHPSTPDTHRRRSPPPPPAPAALVLDWTRVDCVGLRLVLSLVAVANSSPAPRTLS